MTTLLTCLLIFALAKPALAQNETKQVGLVLLYSDETIYTEIVTVPVAATTFEVLRAAHIELIFTETSFGPAVCKIGNDGCPAEDCFCSTSSWAYFHLQGDDWVASEVGVGGFVPEDGAVEGFAFTAYDANFAPVKKPPVMTFAELAAGTATAPAQLPVTGGEQGVWHGSGVMAVAGVVLLVVGLWLRRRVA